MKRLAAVISIMLSLITQPLFAGVGKDVDVRKVQTMLTELCFKLGPVDGSWGKKTERAAEQFFDKHFDGYDGQFTASEFAKLNQFNTGNLRDLSLGVKTLKRCAVDNPSKKGSVKVKQNQSEKIHYFESKWEIPDNADWQPNDATLSFYYKQTASIVHQGEGWGLQPYKVNASSKPFKFIKTLESHKVIDQQLATETILSYLYYEDGAVIYDALPPAERFDIEFSNNSYFPSHSMGKSITSYLVGHAICQGYIRSIEAPIDDWPLMESTLYYGQPLINLLNMQARDTHIIKSGEGRFIETGRHIHGGEPLLSAVQNTLELKNTSLRGRKEYAYSNLTSDVIFNYMMHRVGADFDHFITNFYQNKVKVEYPVYLWMTRLTQGSYPPSMKERIKQGAGQYGISATRYDFLRIAKAIMDDWQSDTCEGKYLKEIYKRRVSKNNSNERWDSSDRRYGQASFGRLTRRYGGQFHTDIVGLQGREILVMNGYNGQQIVIDMDNSRIVVIGAVKADDYDTYKLGFEPIKYGRIR